MVIIDTNIIIDHLRAAKTSKSHLIRLIEKNPKEALAISMITIQELYEGRSTRDEAKEKELLSIVAPQKILPYTYDIAKLAGRVARDLSEPIEFADVAIAATAMLHHMPLLTLNMKHFAHIPELELYTLISKPDCL